MARPGGQSDWSGPRLPNGDELDINAEDPEARSFRPNRFRCDQCRAPATTTRLLVFELRFQGHRAGEWTLCQKCYEWRNPAPNQSSADPLTLAATGA